MTVVFLAGHHGMLALAHEGLFLLEAFALHGGVGLHLLDARLLIGFLPCQHVGTLDGQGLRGIRDGTSNEGLGLTRTLLVGRETSA